MKERVKQSMVKISLGKARFKVNNLNRTEQKRTKEKRAESYTGGVRDKRMHVVQNIDIVYLIQFTMKYNLIVLAIY